MRNIQKNVIIYGNTHKLEFNVWNDLKTGRTHFFLHVHGVCMIYDRPTFWKGRRLDIKAGHRFFHNYKEIKSEDTSIREYKRLIYDYILHEYAKYHK